MRNKLLSLSPVELGLIALIVIITLATRTYHLTVQSLWFDELYSMCRANPVNSWSMIVSDLKTDFHPPLYYFFLNSLFELFPYNDYVARLSSAIIGIIGVAMMFTFGKELKDKQTGLWMALLTSVFFYHIKYSQEVRMYILLFVLVIGSSILLLRILKKPGNLVLIGYVLVSVLMIYTHYYGFFVLLGQALVVLHLLIKKELSLSLFRKFLFSVLGMIILYLPWMPRILDTGQRHHFMEIPDVWYFFEYLYESTGKEPVTTLLFIMGITLFIHRLIVNRKKSAPSGSSNNGELLIGYSMISLFVITYLVSIVKPMVNKHGMLAALPFLIAMVIYGFDRYKPKTVLILIGIMVVTSLINMAFINRYYTKNYKENFKQIATMVHESNNSREGIIALSQVSYMYGYYFKQLNSTINIYNPNEYMPSDIPVWVNEILVVNAPFTPKDQKNLEPINELGFLILYPQLASRKDSIEYFHERWVNYLDANYTLDTTYIDTHRNIEIAFRYLKKRRID